MNDFLIGSKIKKLRGKRTIAEFAKMCALPSKTISDIENNKKELRLKTLYKIAIGLKLKPCELIKLL